MNIRRLSLIICLGAVAVAAAWWWTWQAQAVRQRTSGNAAASSHTTPATSPASGAREENARLARLQAIAAKVQASEHPSVDAIAAVLKQTTNAFDRHRLIGQLLDPHYVRADAIRVLSACLADSDASIRVQAAEALYTLGSNAGKETLLEVIRSSISSAPDTLVDGKRAATVLNRFREVIPPDLLVGLQNKLGQPGVVDIMAMQGDARYTPFVAALAKANPNGAALFYLGLLGAPDARETAQAMFNAPANPDDKIAAGWTLFRTSGDRSGLDYVISVAAHALAADRGYQGATADEVQTALTDFYITKDDVVRDLLRQTAASSHTDIAAKSLASLFYVQKDYSFVDAYVQSYLKSPSTYPAQDANLVWRIAVARNQPDTFNLAKEKAPEEFMYKNIFIQPRPVESWIWSYLGNIPIH